MQNLATSKYSKMLCLLLVFLFLFNIDIFGQGRRRRDRENFRNRQKKEKLKKEISAKLETLPPAFVFQWQFASRNTTKLPVLVEPESVYLPLDDGRIVALEASSGQLRWETQPGGKIISPLIATEENIYISSRPNSSDSNEGILRVINKRTGLTAWTKNFPQAFSNPLVLEEQTIYAASEDNKFYSLNTSGNTNWQVDLGSLAKAKPLFADDEIFIGTEAGLMHSLSVETGEVFWRFQAQSALRGTATVNENQVFFGDSLGNIYALERDTGKLLWQVRVGAAVETAPQLTEKFLIVSCFDNFVYGFNAKNGDTAWKVRLTGRLTFDPILNNQQMLVTPLGSDKIFLLATNGKPLGQYKIDNTNVIIAAPTLEAENLFLVTDEGLVAARAQELAPIKEEKKKNKN